VSKTLEIVQKARRVAKKSTIVRKIFQKYLEVPNIVTAFDSILKFKIYPSAGRLTSLFLTPLPPLRD
jgi:hypothetical protein